MRARLHVACALSLLAAGCGSSSIDINAPSGVKCQVSVANSVANSIPSSGGAGTLSVSTTRDCTWAATSNSSWIVLGTPTTGQGSASITYAVSPNADSAQRTGTVAVNDSNLTVVQEPAPCRYSLTPANATVPSDGGSVTLNLQTFNQE